MYQKIVSRSWILVLALLMGPLAMEPFAVGPFAVADDQADELKVGPRALSKAFRTAAREASPSVVTILSFGQNMDDESASDSLDSTDNLQSPDGRGGDDIRGDDSRGDDKTNRNESEQGDDRQSDDAETLDRQDDLGGPDEKDDVQDKDADATGPVPSPRRSDDGTTLPVTGLGSGVIISADGRIITNNHVIAGAKKVIVTLSDQTEFEAYDIHGDEDSDVASLRIKSPEAFVAATLGNSDSLEIGDWVLAIGSPFKLDATVSAGIISAKHRAIMKISRGRLLQTDAAINPGNSGGPLIDLDGDVVAINTAIATRNGGYQGIGFAIPINQAKWIADELSAHGRVRRAAIGIQLAELNKKIAAKLNLPVDSGVAIYQVIEGSAAAKAGLKPLDVITEFAGEPVRRANDLQEIIERLPIGSTQQVKVQRSGDTIDLQVYLAPIEDPTDVPSVNKAD